MLNAVVINSFLPSQAKSRRTEGQILRLKPGIIVDIYPNSERKKGRKEGRKKMKERQGTKDMEKKQRGNKDLYNNSNEMCFKMSLSHSLI